MFNFVCNQNFDWIKLKPEKSHYLMICTFQIYCIDEGVSARISQYRLWVNNFVYEQSYLFSFLSWKTLHNLYTSRQLLYIAGSRMNTRTYIIILQITIGNSYITMYKKYYIINKHQIKENSNEVHNTTYDKTR